RMARTMGPEKSIGRSPMALLLRRAGAVHSPPAVPPGGRVECVPLAPHSRDEHHAVALELNNGSVKHALIDMLGPVLYAALQEVPGRSRQVAPADALTHPLILLRAGAQPPHHVLGLPAFIV